jgi:excisionase family DNA binding protein
MPQEDILTVPEVARLLRISRGHAYRVMREGILPCIRLGRRYLVPRVRLEQFLATAGDHEGHQQEAEKY